MIVAIDIGNSDIVIGFFTDHGWEHLWRISSHPILGAAEYEKKLRQLALDASIMMQDIEVISVSSVVPDLVQPVCEAWRRLSGLEPFVIVPSQLKHLGFDLRNPNEIGTDLVANAVAAHTLFNEDCLIVDFGTALTFTTVSREKKVLGVSIAPGLKTAIKSLTENTAKLPEIVLELPDSVLGQDTVHAIRSGILYGYVGLVKEMIDRNKAEVNPKLKVVATGGLSKVLHPLSAYFDAVVPNLTLDGIVQIMQIESARI